MKALLTLTIATLLASPVAARDPGTYKQDVHLWYDAFSQKDPTRLDRILAPTWVDIPSPPGLPPARPQPRCCSPSLPEPFPT